MRTRCRSHSRYVDKGIEVCDAWEDFETFLQDMGECPSDAHSIERVNNLLGYTPDNCIWATIERQSYNRSGYRYITKHKNGWRLQIHVRPGLRISKYSTSRELLEDMLADILFEREMHLRLGLFV